MYTILTFFWDAVGTCSSHTPGPDLDRDLPYSTVCTTWYVVVPYPLRPYPMWIVLSTSPERCRRGDEDEDRYVGKEARFGESEGGGQKGNSGGGGDGGSGGEENDEECKDGKGDAAVDSLLGKIIEGYSHRD